MSAARVGGCYQTEEVTSYQTCIFFVALCPMHDDPLEDEFDGILDDAPSTASHSPEDSDLSNALGNGPTPADKADGLYRMRKA